MRIINENPNGKVLGYICYTDDELSERAYHQLMAFECDSIYVDKEFVSVESLEELKKILQEIKRKVLC